MRRDDSRKKPGDATHGPGNAGNDLGATLPEGDPGATMPEDALSVTLPEGSLSATLPENDLGATMPEDGLRTTLAENALSVTLSEGSLSATLPENDLGATMPEGGLRTPLAENALSATLPEGALAATLPEGSSLSATLPEGGLAATLPDNGLSATMPEGLSVTLPERAEGAAASAGALSDTIPIPDGKKQDITVKDRHVAFSIEDAKGLWGDMVDSGHNDSGMTLKVESDDSGSKATGGSATGSKSAGTGAISVGVAAAGYSLRRTKIVDLTESTGMLDSLVQPNDDFYMKKLLGKGGMGTVYLAEQRSLQREVALKVINSKKSKKKNARGKFISEAMVTGELDHPNIIPIYELAESDDGNIFYSMKVVRGQPWSQELKSKTEEENLEVLMRMSDAVGFAHDKGVIHRDLKPENVMLGDYGEILLMDWGLAVSKNPGGKAELLDKKNAFAGTPAYMAPEMARGNVEDISHLTDIYLLGAILFEILTGKRPHSGGSIYICITAAADNYLQATDRDDELMGIARKAMATAPADRYHSVKEFQAALKECQSHRESIKLVEGAKEQLKEAMGCDDYNGYAQSIFGFTEALRLWEGNANANVNLDAARLAYAKCAFSRNDYDLALSQLGGLAGPEAGDLRAAVAKAKRDEEARQRRLKTITRAAIGLTAALLAVLITATIVVYDRMAKEAEAREVAQEQERIAKQALLDTEEAQRSEREAQEARTKMAVERAALLESEQEAKDAALKAAEEQAAALATAQKAQEEALKASQEREAALAREKEAQDQALRTAEERAAALAAAQKAQEEALKAAQEREEAQERALQAAREQAAALEREQVAQKAQQEAERLRQVEEELRQQREEELARKGYLEDDTLWTYDAATAVLKQEEAVTEATPQKRLVALGAGADISFALVPAGRFVMGSNPRDPQHQPNEYLHQVALTREYYLAATELTRAQWRAVVGVEKEEDLAIGQSTASARADTREQAAAEPAYAWRLRELKADEAELPAVGISFREVREILLPRLRDMAPAGWRIALPTEAEWEYACRAGSSSRFFSGSTVEDLARMGWYLDNSNMTAARVGQLEPNAWGLYDMHGNVSEMTEDVFTANYYLESPVEDPINMNEEIIYRVIRGGHYLSPAPNCRSANRSYVHRENRWRETGVRLALRRSE